MTTSMIIINAGPNNDTSQADWFVPDNSEWDHFLAMPDWEEWDYVMVTNLSNDYYEKVPSNLTDDPWMTPEAFEAPF